MKRFFLFFFIHSIVPVALNLYPIPSTVFPRTLVELSSSSSLVEERQSPSTSSSALSLESAAVRSPKPVSFFLSVVILGIVLLTVFRSKECTLSAS